MIEYRWAYNDELPAVAAFFAKSVSLDDSYISHGEVQTGLSLDGKTWVDNLSARLKEDFAMLGDERSVVVAIGHQGLVGATVLQWTVSERVSFMVIEDLAVDPAVRSQGVGAGLVSFAENAGVERGMNWVFLESGLHNEGAHRFFGKHGFEAVSKVFSKKLGERAV